MASNARAIDAAERQMEQMNDATRRYSTRARQATARTSEFRRAQGRLATNIRNTRTIMYAFTGLLGVGGTGFIGRITAGARETILMAEALGTNAESLFANRQEYEKIGKTATDYKNVLTNLIIAQGEAVDGSRRHQVVFEKLGLTMAQVAQFEAAELYDVIKNGSDQGILSATDLNVFLRKESIATFRQVRKGHAELTGDQIQGAADVALAWDNAMAEIEKAVIRTVTESKEEFIQLIDLIEGGATFTVDVLANLGDIPGWLLDAMGGKAPEGFGNLDWLNPATWLTAAMGKNAPGNETPPSYVPSRSTDPFSVGGRAADTQRTLALQNKYFSDPNDPVYRPLNNRIWEDAYRPNSRIPTSETSLVNDPNVQASFLDSQNDLWNIILDAMNPSTSTGGGGGGALDRSAERSERAFTRAFDIAGVRAVRNAIQSSDFTLAREEAEALHELRSTAASQLETAGEQFQAQQAADFALLDSLADIGEAESDYFEESLEEMRKQTADLIDIRNNTRSAKQIAIDTAREAFAGTTLEQPFEDLIAGEEQVNRALILQAARILTDFEANGIFTDALLGFRQIPGSDAGVDDYGNADALGILFTRALEAIVGDDATNIFSAAGGLFSQFGLGQFGNIPTEGLTAPTPVVEIQTIPIHITVEVPPVPLGDAISFVEDVVREALVTHTVRV